MCCFCCFRMELSLSCSCALMLISICVVVVFIPAHTHTNTSSSHIHNLELPLKLTESNIEHQPAWIRCVQADVHAHHERKATIKTSCNKFAHIFSCLLGHNNDGGRERAEKAEDDLFTYTLSWMLWTPHIHYCSCVSRHRRVRKNNNKIMRERSWKMGMTTKFSLKMCFVCWYTAVVSFI